MNVVVRTKKVLLSRWKHCLAAASLIIVVILFQVISKVDTTQLIPTIPTNVFQNQHSESTSSEKDILFSLVREDEVHNMVKSIGQIQKRFNNKFHYDWLFASETNFTTEFRTRIQKAFTSGTALFEQIPHEFWMYPDSIDQYKAAQGRAKLAEEGIIYGGSESYRHMCRFNSGFFYHLDTLADYRYYWRVEPNIGIKCDILEDPFKVMREGNYTYGWTMTMPENKRTVETLWATVKDFIREKKPSMPLENMLDFVTDDNARTYNLCHYWSNFEIGDLDFFRSDQYQDYFEYLDKSGGFFYERWGDAPVHSIAVSLFLPSEKIKHFPNIGYFHNPNQGCPRNKEIRESLNCNCNPDDDWTFHEFSCTNKFYHVAGLPLPPS